MLRGKNLTRLRLAKNVNHMVREYSMVYSSKYQS